MEEYYYIVYTPINACMLEGRYDILVWYFEVYFFKVSVTGIYLYIIL